MCWWSTPSRTPTGRAVIQLPLLTFSRAPPIGVLAREVDSLASISMRSEPTAALTQSSAALVGDAQVVDESWFQAALQQLRVDLRTRAMHQHQLDAEAVQQRQVVEQRIEIRAQRRLAAKADDENASVVGVNVGRAGTQGTDEVVGSHTRLQ